MIITILIYIAWNKWFQNQENDETRSLTVTVSITLHQSKSQQLFVIFSMHILILSRLSSLFGTFLQQDCQEDREADAAKASIRESKVDTSDKPLVAVGGTDCGTSLLLVLLCLLLSTLHSTPPSLISIFSISLSHSLTLSLSPSLSLSLSFTHTYLFYFSHAHSHFYSNCYSLFWPLGE